MNRRLKNLIDAILSSDEPADYKEDDINAIVGTSGVVQAYCDYSNSVVMEDYRMSMVMARANDPQDIRDGRERIDHERRMHHNIAVRQTEFINKLCDAYRVEKFFDQEVDFSSDEKGEYSNDTRHAIAEFIGKFVSEEFEKGINEYEKTFSQAGSDSRNYISEKEVREDAEEYGL